MLDFFKYKEYFKKIKFNLFYYKLLKNKNLKIGRNCKFGIGFYLDSRGSNNKIIIGDGFVTRRNVNLLVRGNSLLEIGKNVFVNNNCTFNCLEQIIIGNDTIFGESVKIYDHNHEYNLGNNELNISKNRFTTAPVVIGQNCWISSNVIILKGVTIGDNCIIGANCVIHKNISSNSRVIQESNLIIKNTK
jgi:acetyltransferase-like isoleucine patch superfamily enzyme